MQKNTNNALPRNKPTICHRRQITEKQERDTFLKVRRHSDATLHTNITASGSSLFTWKMGHPITRPISVQYGDDRDARGSVVKPICKISPPYFWASTMQQAELSMLVSSELLWTSDSPESKRIWAHKWENWWYLEEWSSIFNLAGGTHSPYFNILNTKTNTVRIPCTHRFRMQLF